MTIGNCDCCDRRNVPGSVVNCPGEPFACYPCQDDVPDPYCEIEQACFACNGEGRDIRTGVVYEPGCGHAHMGDVDCGPCDACNGTGSEWVAPRALTLDDLEERTG